MLSSRIKNPSTSPDLCIIWMHGLGSNAENMLALADELPTQFAIRHIALNAPVRPITINAGMRMQAWYDITGFTVSSREDEPGIRASLEEISKVVEDLITQGMPASRIILAGFSQGGAMSLLAGLQSNHPIGGVISLSSYLPLANQIKPTLDRSVPFFIGCGLRDTVVIPEWSLKSADWLKENDYQQVSVHQYPIEHTVCFEELNEMAFWLTTHFSELSNTAGEDA